MEGEEKDQAWQRGAAGERALEIALTTLPQRILGAAGQPASAPRGSVYQAWIFLPV